MFLVICTPLLPRPQVTLTQVHSDSQRRCNLSHQPFILALISQTMRLLEKTSRSREFLFFPQGQHALPLPMRSISPNQSKIWAYPPRRPRLGLATGSFSFQFPIFSHPVHFPNVLQLGKTTVVIFTTQWFFWRHELFHL